MVSVAKLGLSRHGNAVVEGPLASSGNRAPHLVRFRFPNRYPSLVWPHPKQIAKLFLRALKLPAGSDQSG
jgi:hypothetical protein